jgi:hypothetical protein
LLPALQTVLSKVDGRQSIWVAALPPQELRAELSGNEFLKYSADRLQSISGGVQITDALRANVLIQTEDAKAAKGGRDFLRGAKELLIIGLETNEKLAGFGPVFADMLRTLRLECQNNAILIEGTITANLIDTGIKKANRKP